MKVKGKDGRIYEVEASVAQELVERGEAEIIAEPPVGRASDAVSKKALGAERREEDR